MHTAGLNLTAAAGKYKPPK